jgi:hypothetical protein
LRLAEVIDLKYAPFVRARATAGNPSLLANRERGLNVMNYVSMAEASGRKEARTREADCR